MHSCPHVNETFIIIMKEDVSHKLSTGVSALLQARILRAAAAWGGRQDAGEWLRK